MEARESLHKATELAMALARRRGEVGKVADKIVRLLEEVDRGLGSQHGDPQARQSRKGDVEIEYRVEKTAAGETLAEHRKSGASQPFRCPKRLYDAMVEVLGSAATPLSLEDVAAAVSAKMGLTPGDYQLRVPIRLWLSVTPPLIVRHRARYRAVDRSFASAARTIWDRLRHGVH